MDPRQHLRSELSSYCTGKYFSAAKCVPKLRIAVVGQTGTGKTCLINTVWRVLRNESPSSPSPLPEQDSGAEGTVIVEDLEVSPAITLVDTRGFFTSNGAESMAFIRIIEGQYKHGCKMDWIPEDESVKTVAQAKNTICGGELVDLEDRVHGVIFVLKATDPRLAQNQYASALFLPRQWCREVGISPVAVITHEDQIKNSAQQNEIRQHASAASGCAPDNIFFISNCTSQNKNITSQTELAVLQIMRSSVNLSERFLNLHRPQKTVSGDVVEVSTTDGKILRFKLLHTATIADLHSLVQKRIKIDTNMFSLVNEEDEEFVDCMKVKTIGKRFFVRLDESLSPYNHPALWGDDPWGLTGYKEVDLLNTSDEFKYVNWLVSSTFDANSEAKLGCVNGQWPCGLKVHRVTRIHNKSLWCAYCDKKRWIKQKLGDASNLNCSQYLREFPSLTPLLDPSVNEYLLFHGCKEELVSNLMREGPDFRVGRINGMFGAGFYLAENSSKSNGYIPCPICHHHCLRQNEQQQQQQQPQPQSPQLSPQSPPQPDIAEQNEPSSEPEEECGCACPNPETIQCKMLLFRVILGDAHICKNYSSEKYRGTKEMPIRRPPRNDLGVHDCVLAERRSLCPPGEQAVAMEKNPKYREIVVYELYQAYPAYLITFSRKPPGTPIATEHLQPSTQQFWRNMII